MKVLIPGGTGQVGEMLARALAKDGHEIVVLSRSAGPEIRGAGEARSGGPKRMAWDGETLGPWAEQLDGCDVVINLAGRTVNCRYTEENLRQMMDSRVLSTRAVGRAVAQAGRPPRVWLQMSTATIYAHRFDAPNDEASGILGGSEPDAPAYWKRSIDIALAWERELRAAETPRTRKVALRTAMVMSPDRGGVFDVLFGMTRRGLGGAVAGGRQMVSWIHEVDFVRALRFLIERDDLTGEVNVCAPNPLPQSELMAVLRRAAGMPVGLPATRWMAEIGAFFLRTDTELLMKSRYVVPQRLLDAGFTFQMPDWPSAAADLAQRWRTPEAHAASASA